MSKIYMESISYDQENIDKSKVKPSNNLFKSHRKTTSALVRNADATLFDITNSPLSNKSSNNKSSDTPTIVNINSTPIKQQSSTQSTNSTPLKTSSILDNTSLSPKSSRYTIAATPTKPNSSTTTPTNMMTLTQSQPTPSPNVVAPKSFFSTPVKGAEKKLKKKQLEKEYQMLQDKIKIMERIRTDNDSDIERMKISLIDTLTDNDRLQRRVAEMEEIIESMKKEMNKGSYESWKGYCSLQDSPPGVSTRYSKKRAMSSNIANNQL
eukprot:gene16686-19834_t